MPNCGQPRALIFILPCLVLAACSSSQPDTLGRSGPALAPADFVDRTAEVVEVQAAPRVPVTSDMISGPIAASQGVLDVTALPGRPGAITGAASTVASDAPSGVRPVAISNAAGSGQAALGPVALVDVKVGDINGRPVYANTFLDDMADQLRAEAARMKFPEWQKFAKEKIDEKLNREIRDELLRAEAVGNFSPEQKQGFLSFMKSVQERVQSQSLGSRAAADERLESTEGMSLDQYMKKREQEELIGFQLREKIEKRVSVPWRDIKQEYDRYFDSFNPPPKAQFRLVQIPADKPDDIKAFEEKRAAGESFATLAADKTLNRYKPETGGLEEREIKGDRAKAGLFGNEALNAAARTISPGETVGPIKVGDNQAWLSLDSIIEKNRTLYDAQMDIESILKRRRAAEATDKYIARLRERASISSSKDMTSQLLTVAESRFWTLPRQ